MEELTLEDLTFEGTGEVFDAFKQPDAKPTEDGDKIVPPVVEDENKIKPPASEDTDNPDSESVATGDENKNQGQAGKANDKGDEANSSSPKLNDSEQLYSTLASHLIKEGALSDLDPLTIKSVGDLNAAIQKEADSRLESNQKLINEAMRVGAPVPVIAELTDTITKLESITEEMITNKENMTLNANLIAQDFVNKGYDAERAATLAQRSIESGTGVEDAKFALAGVIKHETDRRAGIIQTAKDTETKSLDAIKAYLQDDKNKVGDIKLTTAQHQEIFKQMTTDVGNRESAFIKYQRANPIESRVKLETIFFLTKGLTDFSAFGVAAKTETANELETLMRGTSFTEDGKVVTEIKDDKSNFSLADFKDLKIDTE